MCTRRRPRTRLSDTRCAWRGSPKAISWPASLNARRAEWQKVVKLWDKVVAYVEDPKTQPDAVKIMAARSGVSPAEYLPMLTGTRLGVMPTSFRRLPRES